MLGLPHSIISVFAAARPKRHSRSFQNFEKVMKLFFQHLDDPHHKVAQAALSTLADIIHLVCRFLLPALLRSLDEQRSPKAKLAVIEFAISSFNKHSINTEGSGNSGILKLWLPKLTPLKERQRLKSSYDPSDVVGTSSEEGYVSVSKKSHFFGRYSAGSVDSDGGRKWSSTQESAIVTGNAGQTASDEARENLYQNFETGSNNDVLNSKSKDLSYTINPLDHMGVGENIGHDSEAPTDLEPNHEKLKALKVNSTPDTGPSIPQILHLIGNGTEESPTASKRDALHNFAVVLEVLDDFDSSTRELSLSLIIEMLKNQKDAMEDSVEIVIEKLLHVTKDVVPKVSNESEHCLSIVLSQYDPFRCLSVIVPLLVTEDEKTLVTCINCLTKVFYFHRSENQSADVRKTVVFCLVDIYIMLGKAFLPYLEGLNSTQLRLVTIYANRISQARTGSSIDTNHD
ncbi:hypothetical protein L7F22_067334 [Adiantum nelumboides]|nr:hypothetical protein [Adiantum nelumboides]